MSDEKIVTAMCASCGENKQLCDSARINGIKQPRICKDCLLNSLDTGDYGINEIYWILQLMELNDTESLEIIKRQHEDN